MLRVLPYGTTTGAPSSGLLSLSTAHLARTEVRLQGRVTLAVVVSWRPCRWAVVSVVDRCTTNIISHRDYASRPRRIIRRRPGNNMSTPRKWVVSRWAEITELISRSISQFIIHAWRAIPSIEALRGGLEPRGQPALLFSLCFRRPLAWSWC